jgi:hypothetical protein
MFASRGRFFLLRRLEREHARHSRPISFCLTFLEISYLLGAHKVKETNLVKTRSS